MKVITHRFIPWMLELTLLARCFVIALLLHVALLIVIGTVRIVGDIPGLRPPPTRPLEGGLLQNLETVDGPPGGVIPTSTTTAEEILGQAVNRRLRDRGSPMAPGNGDRGQQTMLEAGPTKLPDGAHWIPVIEGQAGDWHPPPGAPGELELRQLTSIGKPGGGGTGPGKGTGPGSPFDNRKPVGRTNVTAGGLDCGNPQTERAVTAALRWLKSQQQPDGSWPGGSHTPALSGLALLCFFGRAEDSDSVEFGSTIDRGLRYLISTVKSDGLVTGNMYHQGIVAITLAEAYALTKQPELRDPLQRSIRVILAAQQTPKLDPSDRGGWRYTPHEATADLSVSGWQIMALKSAQTAGIDVPDVALSNAVDYVWNRHGDTGFAYTGRGAAYAMTGVGTLSQLFLGQGRDRRLEKPFALLAATPPKWEQANLYAWYYAALALYQVQGHGWDTWNKHYWQTLVTNQDKDDGYWELPESATESTYGRVYATTLCTLMLEVYYRYLPMYRGGQAVR